MGWLQEVAMGNDVGPHDVWAWEGCVACRERVVCTSEGLGVEVAVAVKGEHPACRLPPRHAGRHAATTGVSFLRLS